MSSLNGTSVVVTRWVGPRIVWYEVMPVIFNSAERRRGSKSLKMAPMSQEDIEWFKSTFHPIPKPELPDDSIEYSLYYVPSDPAPATVDEAAETRSRLVEVQRSAAELTKELLRDYIWQREGFRLEITKEDGADCLLLSSLGTSYTDIYGLLQASAHLMGVRISATRSKMNG